MYTVYPSKHRGVILYDHCSTLNCPPKNMFNHCRATTTNCSKNIVPSSKRIEIIG